MPRRARLDAPGALHHVMIRGIERSTIFRDDEDRRDFIFRVGELVKKTGTRILAWVLMDNHVHFLLFSGEEGISSFMRRLLTGYAIRFNRRHQRSGYLFQNRYKSIICEEDAYLLELVRYIHLNPLRSSVVKSMEELGRYRWSGHSVLVGKQRNDWQEIKYVLHYFGRKRRKAIQAYWRFVEGGKDQGRRPELVGGGLIRSLGGWSRVLSFRGKRERVEHDSRILGGEDFVKEVLGGADKRLRMQMKNKGGEDSIVRVIKERCFEAGLKEEELRSGGKRRKVSDVRGKIAYYLSKEMGLSMAEIARNLGVGASAIGMAIRRMEDEEKK